MQQALYMNNPQELYRRQGVLTASPIELIVLLYDGLRKDMVLAQRSIAKGDMEGAHRNLIKSQDIVTELLNSLDMNFEISEELAHIYDFILRHLEEANLKKDGTLIGEALELVEELRGAWKEISESQKGLLPQGLQE
jgi:flagellar protein FliS